MQEINSVLTFLRENFNLKNENIVYIVLLKAKLKFCLTQNCFMKRNYLHLNRVIITSNMHSN